MRIALFNSWLSYVPQEYRLTDWPTVYLSNCIQQSPLWEDNLFPVSQENSTHFKENTVHAHHLSLSSAILIQSTPSHPISSGSISLLLFSTDIRSSEWSLSFTFPNRTLYTGCPRRKGPNFGRVFLRSNYTAITHNTYIQSSMVTEILNIEKWGLVWCLRTVLCPWRHTSRIRSCIPTLSLDAAHCDLGYDQMLAVYSG